MKLSSKGRYAVMALADLAKFDPNEPVSLRDISLRQGISLVYLEQLFLKLKKNKIVKSVRGNKGGYILNKIGEPYIKSEIGNQNHKGLGLGIFIGKTLLERNRAKVICRNSQTRSGAEVVITWKNSDLKKL